MSAWSERENTDDDLKRLNLARARDLKQLRDEFKFILDENMPTPAQPKKPEPQPLPFSFNFNSFFPLTKAGLSE